jgi:hypothetical protein
MIYLQYRPAQQTNGCPISGAHFAADVGNAALDEQLLAIKLPLSYLATRVTENTGYRAERM